MAAITWEPLAGERYEDDRGGPPPTAAVSCTPATGSSFPSQLPWRSVRCPACGSLDDKVVDSRLADDGAAIRRRRECLACNRRFTTFERLEELPLSLVVVKRS